MIDEVSSPPSSYDGFAGAGLTISTLPASVSFVEKVDLLLSNKGLIYDRPLEKENAQH